MPTSLSTLLHRFEQEKICYCLLRDSDRLDQMSQGGELDLLVDPQHFTRLANLVAQQGFVRLPDWGYAPHHFFVTYDQASDCWLKLDVVTEVAYGQPLPILRTALGRHCLEHRQRQGEAYVPAPACELVTLLLHCILDKGAISATRGARLQLLCQAISDEPYVTALLAEYWQAPMSWRQLREHIRQGNWPHLLGERNAVRQRLQKRDQLGVFYRQMTTRLLRKANVWVTARRPRSLNVAVLAPDGAGKSTLVAGIQKSFYFPVRTIYMGLYQKQSGGANRWLAKVPGITGRLLTQWQRYLTGRAHQLRRRLVIFDRYTYDALLPSRQQMGKVKQYRRWLLAYSCPAPDVVIFLDAPGELLYARKREHSATLLEQQRQGYLALRPTVPQMIVVDATRDPEAVRCEVTALIWREYCERQNSERILAN